MIHLCYQCHQEDLRGLGQIKNVGPLHTLVTLVCMWSMLSYGDMGHAPRKFLKIRLSEIEFESDLGSYNKYLHWWLLSIRRSRAWIYIASKLSAKYTPGPSLLRSAFLQPSFSLNFYLLLLQPSFDNWHIGIWSKSWLEGWNAVLFYHR